MTEPTHPPVKIVLNTEPSDLNYGGWDVLVKQSSDGVYLCVAETKEFPTVEVQPGTVVTPEQALIENLNYVHCVFQELEVMGIELPMGDYDMLYEMVEYARDYFDDLGPFYDAVADANS